MIKATKIKMNDGKENTDSLTEIKEIYLEGVVNSGFYMKEPFTTSLLKIQILKLL